MKRLVIIFVFGIILLSTIGGLYVLAIDCGQSWNPDGADTYNRHLS